MRRMFSENQINKMIEEGSLSPEQIQELLVGKFVRIMDAPESTTLTSEQLEQVKEGVFIQGTFMGLTNPILLPAQKVGTYYRGMYFATYTGGINGYIGAYEIDDTNYIYRIYGLVIDLSCVGSFNGKNVPAYPSDTGTFLLKCVDGTLTWVAE